MSALLGELDMMLDRYQDEQPGWIFEQDALTEPVAN